MIAQTLEEAVREACAAAEVKPPKRRLVPGQWVRSDTLGRNGKDDASILIFDDQRGGIVWNHQTSVNHRFRIGGRGEVRTAPISRPDPERERRRQAEQQEVRRICETIVQAARQEEHPYLASKGFPDQLGLVCHNLRDLLPASRLGEAIARALPESTGPLMIVPGRIGKTLTTVQFIASDGTKKNILRGRMGGACHRIATGRDTWVCEGIATALSVRAALRLLGRSATILSAFSASNVERVANGIADAIIAADHDNPVEAFDGKGAGEFHAARSGRQWIMPPAMGDFNDMHQREGLRAVALHLREIAMG